MIKQKPKRVCSECEYRVLPTEGEIHRCRHGLNQDQSVILHRIAVCVNWADQCTRFRQRIDDAETIVL